LTLNGVDAAAAARSDRTVSVCTTARQGAAEIAVRDNGPGLPLDSQQRLFEPFFTTKNQGLGMGLAIVRSIVERHHGRVHAENAGGVGAVFRVTLPAHVGAVAETPRRCLPRMTDREEKYHSRSDRAP